MTKMPKIRKSAAERKKEIAVLRLLRQDARMKVVNIAKKLDISAASASVLIRKTDRKYVSKYSSLVDFEKLGYFVGSFFVIRPSRDGKGDAMLMDFLSCCRNINSMSMSSSGDVLVEVYFRNMADFVDFRHFVEEFAESAEEHEIVCAVKREEFMV